MPNPKPPRVPPAFGGQGPRSVVLPKFRPGPLPPPRVPAAFRPGTPAVQPQVRPGPRLPAAVSRRATSVQRKGGVVTSNKVTLAEAESAKVGSGGTIDYTALSAGCMAVTVWLTGGGGAGVHLTMKDFESESTSAQLSAFKGVIGSTTVTKVELVSDVFNGWYFKFGMDEEEMPVFLDSPPVAGSDTVTPSVSEYASSDTSARAWAEVAFKCSSVTSKWSQKAGPYTF